MIPLGRAGEDWGGLGHPGMFQLWAVRMLHRNIEILHLRGYCTLADCNSLVVSQHFHSGLWIFASFRDHVATRLSKKQIGTSSSSVTTTRDLRNDPSPLRSFGKCGLTRPKSWGRVANYYLAIGLCNWFLPVKNPLFTNQLFFLDIYGMNMIELSAKFVAIRWI